MDKLTAKQQAFIDAYCNKDNETFGNASKSYQYAYSSGNMTPRGVAQSASKLLTNAKIKQAIADYALKNEVKSIYDKEIVRQRIDQTWRMAVEKGDVMACIASARLQAQEQAMLTDKVQSEDVTRPSMSKEEEEQFREVARQLNIKVG